MLPRALFVCIHNAGRSQMAQAFWERLGGPGRSAGSDPAAQVHPEVLEAMGELGIDLADRVPHRLDQADAEWADVVVTMGCGDACPFIPGKRYLDWELDDPKGRGVEAVRGIRDEVERRIAQLASEFDASARACQGDPPTSSHCSAWPPRAG
ncbi:MAG: protein tyrosine phosphatase [Chloroflexi bacterium]|nr:protein tyrosine phosphatase [Chloroflexota bacterium]